MTIIKEVADLLEMLSGVVENTRSIVKAVSDGREYLARYYPDAREKFAKLLEQMQVTVEGLATATGVMSGFRFVIGSEGAAEKDLVRFNDYLISHKTEVTRLRGHIRTLKADCGKIRELRDALTHGCKEPSWSSMFGLIGLQSEQQREQLAHTVSNFYADDQRMIEVIQDTLELASQALSDVDQSLGESGVAHPYLVPRAARMLGVYSEMFREPSEQLQGLIQNLGDTAEMLKRNE